MCFNDILTPGTIRFYYVGDYFTKYCSRNNCYLNYPISYFNSDIECYNKLCGVRVFISDISFYFLYNLATVSLKRFTFKSVKIMLFFVYYACF